MVIHFATISTVLVGALCLVPCSGAAQTPQVGATELAQARTLLNLSRAELSAEQFALLSRRLAAAETAYAELTVVARGSQAAAAVVERGAAASAQTTATGGRALLGGAARLLPLLLLFWPATAHAPGTNQEMPEVRAARSKAEESLRELAQAAREVEAQRAATMAKSPPKDSDDCTKFAESGTGGRERRCHYKCGTQNICVRVDGSHQCPEGPAGPLSDIKYREIAGLPRCPPVDTLAR
jgi:hypothetical protein